MTVPVETFTDLFGPVNQRDGAYGLAAADSWFANETFVGAATASSVEFIDSVTGYRLVLLGSFSYLSLSPVQISGSSIVRGLQYRDPSNNLLYGAADLPFVSLQQFVDTADANPFYSVYGPLTLYETRGTRFNDLLETRNGLDTLYGFDGNDTLYGNGSPDYMDGGNGDDQLFGGTENDTLIGGAGRDTLSGGPGDDQYIVVDSEDVLIDNEGFDTIVTTIDWTLVPGIQGLRLTGSATSGTGSEQNNRIEAQGGASYLRGMGGADTLVGGAGADLLEGGDGNDQLGGGSANDTLRGEEGNDNLNGSDGNDLLVGGNADDYLDGGNGDDTVEGGSGNDTLIASPGRDELYGGPGNDDLTASTGGGLVDGGPGADLMKLWDSPAELTFTVVLDDPGDRIGWAAGQRTSAKVIVQSSVDFALPAFLSDLLLLPGAGSGIGNDAINRLTGNSLSNVLSGLGGGDSIDGAGGDDVIDGGDGSDSIDGGDGADALWGSAGADYIAGGAGNDLLNGGIGKDTLAGGSGNDVYEIQDVPPSSFFDVSSSNARSSGYFDSTTRTLTAYKQFFLFMNVVLPTQFGPSTSASLMLTAQAGVAMQAGTTHVVSRERDFGRVDVAFDGTGRTSVSGSFTIHELVVLPDGTITRMLVTFDVALDSASDRTTGTAALNSSLISGPDVVVETADNGTDEVRSGYSYVLASNVENLALTGTGNVNGTGNGLANFLSGNVAVNQLRGLDGDDTLDGGAGNDVVEGGNGDDRIIARLSDGNDRITGGPGVDTLDLSNVTGPVQVDLLSGLTTGSAGNDTLLDVIERVTGTAFGDVLSGSNEAEQLAGGAGADQYFGNGGDDTIIAGHDDGNDTASGGGGFDVIDFSAVQGVVQINQLGGVITGSAGNDVLLDVFEQVIGTQFDDVLSGGNGGDVLDGNGGNDQFFGNRGDDLMRGGDGDDRFWFSNSDGDDRLLGGNGFDILDYSSLDGVVQVNQLAGTTSGTAGNDTLLDVFEQVIGTAFGDVLSGGNGINSLKGGGGNDTFFGNGGDDYISGGTGNDLITFGAGNDTLDFRNGEGIDTITDFVAGAGSDDTLTLKFYSGLGTTTLASLQGQGRIVQNGANTEITLSGGDMVILENVVAGNLHADDFVFF